MARRVGASGTVLVVISVITIAILLASAINAIPSPLLTKRIGFVGLVSYYVSQPIPGIAPGLTVRVFLVNGSTIEPASALIDVYANTPNGIVELARGFGTALNVPFNNPNWMFALERWVAIGAPFTEYDTSLIVFVTYVDGNHSWIEPIFVPYNVGWALSALWPVGIGGGVPRYIVLNAYIDVNKVKPQTVRVISSMDRVTDPQVFGEYEGYVVYNCSLSGPSPPILLQPYFEYVPTAMCIGLNGSIPYAWVTWSQGILSTDNGTDIAFNVDFAGTLNWHAMAVSYGDVGTSYSADENWSDGLTITIGTSRASQPGSYYFYYNGTFAYVTYEVWYVDSADGAVAYMGNTNVTEVLYVPPNAPPRFALDYGNGSMTILYYGAVNVPEQYLGYPILNASSVVDYAFVSPSGYAECNGPVTGQNGEYSISLGGVETAYSSEWVAFSVAALITGVLSLAAPLLTGSALLGYIFGAGSAAFTIASFVVPPTSTVTTSTTLDIGFNSNLGGIFVSVVNGTVVTGLPTFGFILNATNYYGNPSVVVCNY